MTSSNSVPSISQEERALLQTWLTQHADELPPVVKHAFSHYSLLLEGLNGNQYRLKSVLLQLRRAMGIIAASEKRRSGHPVGPLQKPGEARPKDPVERLRLKMASLKDRITWHRDTARRLRRKSKNLHERLMKLEDIILSPEEEAEIAAENAGFSERLAEGGGPQPAMESAGQAFMVGSDVKVEEDFTQTTVDPAVLQGETVVSRLSEERTRYGFSIAVSKITVDVEKVIVRNADASTRIFSASTREIGPPGMAITWDFLANMVILVAQYAMPFNRLGSLLSIPEKRFSSAMLSRMFCYTAKRFVPVYLHLFAELANARLLSGDDTETRVMEMRRFVRDAKADPHLKPPWEAFATQATAQTALKREADPDLGILTAPILGFEWERLDGNGPKRSLKTSLLWGRKDPDDPRSAIIFYRSHLGSFGNLLSLCLKARDPEYKDLVVQSDLSSSNLVQDPELKQRFAIQYAGCASHARRPFALFEDEDPELCAAMLCYFEGLYLYEKTLDCAGRNEQNVQAVRGFDSLIMWENILELAEIIVKKWSKQTKLGIGARYIIKHYPELTAYLKSPSIAIANDFSERMLRLEKLIQANALFRDSINGRFALDINRTILQTAIAAGVSLQDYMIWVFKMPPEALAASPGDFTPLAYRKVNSKILH